VLVLVCRAAAVSLPHMAHQHALCTFARVVVVVVLSLPHALMICWCHSHSTHQLHVVTRMMCVQVRAAPPQVCSTISMHDSVPRGSPVPQPRLAPR
jgi:hypothetical protein